LIRIFEFIYGRYKVVRIIHIVGGVHRIVRNIDHSIVSGIVSRAGSSDVATNLGGIIAGGTNRIVRYIINCIISSFIGGRVSSIVTGGYIFP
jgi:hypothetical protein